MCSKQGGGPRGAFSKYCDSQNFVDTFVPTVGSLLASGLTLYVITCEPVVKLCGQLVVSLWSGGVTTCNCDPLWSALCHVSSLHSVALLFWHRYWEQYAIFLPELPGILQFQNVCLNKLSPHWNWIACVEKAFTDSQQWSVLCRYLVF